MPPETDFREDLAALAEDTPSESVDTSAAGTDTTAPVQVSGEPVFEPPKHWSDTDRTLFGTAPRPIQERWLARENEIQKGFTTSGQKLAKYEKDLAAFDEVLKPYDQDIGLRGLSRQQFVSSLVNWNKALNDDPPSAIRRLLQQFGVDPKSLTEQQNTEPNPALERVTQLEQKLSSFEQERRSQELRENLNKVTAFAEAKGEDGKAAHPYFDEVANDIKRLISLGERDIEVAYSKACRLNDSVWERMQADKAAAAQLKQTADRKAAVSKAQRASVGSTGEGNGLAKSKTLRGDLEDAFSALG